MARPQCGAMTRLAGALSLFIVLSVLGGCINLPPSLERELACPAAGAPDNFGNADACVRTR